MSYATAAANDVDKVGRERVVELPNEGDGPGAFVASVARRTEAPERRVDCPKPAEEHDVRPFDAG